MEPPSPPSSFLPEPLIHKILAHLPPKDAIRASASSKTWRSAWLSSPILSIDETKLPFKATHFFDYAHRSLALWLERCNHRGFNVHKFSLCANITDDQSFSRFVQLVSMAIKRDFKGFTEELRDYNLLPDPFYEAKHLTITNRKLPIADYARLVGAMMKLFPCVETLVLKTECAKIFIEFNEDGSLSLKYEEISNMC